MTTDLKAAYHVFFNSYDYPKPQVIKYLMSSVIGNGPFCCINSKLRDSLMTLLFVYLGILSVEGDEHKHQVRSPAGFFWFQDLFVNFQVCLILQVAQDVGQLCWATGVSIV